MTKNMLERPIEVNPSTLPAQLASAMRVVTVLVGGATAVIGFLSARDLLGLIQYLRSDEFLPVAGAASAAAAFLYGQWKLRHERKKLVVSADAAPNSVAKVVK